MALMQCGKNILRQIIKDGSSLRNTSSITQPLLYSGHGIRYRKLEVILTTSIEKLGKAGETVKVAPGYFRNHLMPKMLAVPNIEKFAYLVREQRKIYEPKEVEEVRVVPKTEEDKMKDYQIAATRLDNAVLVLRRFITTGNDLREHVTKDELVSEVARQLCIRIEPENLHLPSPLSTLGEFEVPLRLPKSIPLPVGKVQWTLNVKIRRK
ncbi:Ribosomal protein L9, N-terminal [Dillenia turbinata]|uniref:Large ribosomal subunit protein bL9c n=1 Tax=Dillenia turbinata TaxID=194707 RepID=A0AAN8UZW4_9MAGN